MSKREYKKLNDISIEDDELFAEQLMGSNAEHNSPLAKHWKDASSEKSISKNFTLNLLKELIVGLEKGSFEVTISRVDFFSDSRIELQLSGQFKE